MKYTSATKGYTENMFCKNNTINLNTFQCNLHTLLLHDAILKS